MYVILGILIIVAVNVAIGLVKAGLKAGYDKVTEPQDTLRKTERDADRVARHFEMQADEALRYKNMQRFGVCFARYAFIVSMADGEVDPNELFAILDFFKGANPEYIRAISEHLRRDFENPEKIDWRHNNEIAKELLADPFFKDYDALLFDGLLAIAAVDGDLDDEELKIITGIMAAIGWPEDRILSHLENHFGIIKENGEEGKRERAYRALGLCDGCSIDEVKKAYRNMAKQYHPDMVCHLGENLQRTATERFHEIRDAYEYLSQSF